MRSTPTNASPPLTEPVGECAGVERRVGPVLVARLRGSGVGGAVPRPAVDDTHVGGELAQVPAGATG